MLVSILIPCFNAEPWISQAIESALAQTWPEKEVIVVDDGSTDRSLEIIKSFGERIRWETGPNRGGNPARNRLLALARGEWLQYLDADDYLQPDKIEKQLADAAPETDVLYGPYIWEQWTAGRARLVPHPLPGESDLWTLLARWELPQTGACLWRKSAILAAGGWKPDQPCCQEHELYLRLLISGARFTRSEHAGAVYRSWSTDTVCNKNPSLTAMKRIEVVERLEQFLLARGALTPTRRDTINQQRFRIARSQWQRNHACAIQLMARVEETQPDFRPQSTSSPVAYAIAYKLLGFARTERLADRLREVFRGGARQEDAVLP